MDFLDPLYQRRHIMRLYTGYGLMAIAIFLAVTMLLLTAYGFQLRRDGQVLQNGLLFASSRPTAATVYLDGISTDKQTNTRMNVPEGSYELELKRSGYRSWHHRIAVIGGKLLRYDYPLLIPETLTTTNLQTIGTKKPGVVSTTPDNRWLLLQQDALVPKFLMFDLKNTKATPVTVTIPADSYAAGGKQTWEVIEWASDKTHVLLKHGYGTKGASEFILLNRTAPESTVNLSEQFNIVASKLSFIEGKFDKYYLYIASDRTLRTAKLNDSSATVLLDGVLQYAAIKADTVLYVAAPTSKTATNVNLHLKRGDSDVVIRSLVKRPTYRIALTEYLGSRYVAVADTVKTQNFVYVYKNPLTQLANKKLAVPVSSLKIAPSFLSFSAGGRFLLAEHGTKFAAYDAEYKKSVVYSMAQPLDKGQTHASWLDGAHLQYVSNGQLYLFNFDGTNAQILMPAAVGWQTLYDSEYKFAYTIAPPTSTQKNYMLTSTSLRTPVDL